MNISKRIISVCLVFVMVASVFGVTVINASALSENARYYEAVPETAYATVGEPFKIFYNNVLSLPGLKISFYVPETLTKKCYNNRIEITAQIPGDFVIPWCVYDDEYVMVDSGEMLFVARETELKNVTALVLGDSTVNEGFVTQNMLDTFEENGKTLTLLGTRGTYPNCHEGRGGWSSSLYCTKEEYGIHYNPFYNDGFDFSYYMSTQGYDQPDFVVIQLGINDIKKMTLEDYSSDKVLSYFDEIVLSIQEYSSNLPIIITVTIPPSEKIEDFNESTVVAPEFEYRNNIIHFASDLMNYFDGVENIYFSPVNCGIDSSKDFKNALHPTENGYKVIAETHINTLNCIMNKTVKVKAPEITQAKSVNGYISLTWKATYGATSYDIIRNGIVVATVNSLNYKDAEISSGESYKYKIKAVSEDGRVYTSKTKTVYYLGTPVLKSATTTKNGVCVKWNAVNSAENYSVYRKTANSSWTRIGNTTGISFTDKTAKSGTKYFYTVIANSSVAKSGYDSSGVSVYYIATPPLSSITNKNGSVVVKWGSVKGAKSYNVYRKTSKNGSWVKIASTTGTTYTDKNIKSGNNYFYTVKAYNGSNTSSFVTSGIATKYLSTPKLTKISSGKNGVTVSYSKITGATGYAVYRKTGNGNWSKIATVTGNSKTSYLDKTAKKNVTYTYTVRAVNGKYMSSYNTKGITVKDKY
ncbi:MAG: hypothetical protein IJN49_00695 [Clostridia bacterium]|nr:hypothetical protein [Clostridia bacterium]